MKRLVLNSLLSVSLLLSAVSSSAQTVYPSADGQRARYSAYIELPQAYVSGICVLLNDGGVVKGSLFNEFGLTALDFTYCPQRQKVKLHSVVAMMDKWYIRRVLRKDLAQLMQRLQQGETQYRNERRHITYQFTPIADEVTQ